MRTRLTPDTAIHDPKDIVTATHRRPHIGNRTQTKREDMTINDRKEDDQMARIANHSTVACSS